MQEQQHQIKLYGFLQRMVYAVVIMDILTLFFQNAKIFVLSDLLKNFAKMGVFFPPINAKVSTLILIGLVAVGTRAKKKKDLNITKDIILPIIIGLLMIIGSLALVDKASIHTLPKINPYQVGYALLSLVGAVITQMGADSISKLMQQKMGKDRWNV